MSFGDLLDFLVRKPTCRNQYQDREILVAAVLDDCTNRIVICLPHSSVGASCDAPASRQALATLERPTGIPTLERGNEMATW